MTLVWLLLLALPSAGLAQPTLASPPVPCTPPSPLASNPSPQDTALYRRDRLLFEACSALSSPRPIPPDIALATLLDPGTPPIRGLLDFASRYTQVTNTRDLHFGDMQLRPGAYVALYLAEGVFLRMSARGTDLCDLFSLELDVAGFYRPFPDLEAAALGPSEAELRMLLQLAPAGIQRYRPWPDWNGMVEPLADRPPSYFPLGFGLGIEAGTYANYLIGPRVAMKLPLLVRSLHLALVGTAGWGRTPPDIQDVLRESHHESPFWGLDARASWTPTARWRAHPELSLAVQYRMVDILEDPDSPNTKLRRSVVLLAPGAGLWWNNGLRLHVSIPVGWDGLWWPQEDVSGSRPPALGAALSLEWHFSRDP